MPVTGGIVAFFVMFGGGAMRLCSELMLPGRFTVEILHGDCFATAIARSGPVIYGLLTLLSGQVNDRAKSLDLIRSQSIVLT